VEVLRGVAATWRGVLAGFSRRGGLPEGLLVYVEAAGDDAFTICRDLHGMRREYFWEQVAGCWGMRKRGDSQAPLAVAAGDYRIGIAAEDLNPPPATTIAWRLAHIILSEGDLVVRSLLLGAPTSVCG
jgi:hypothetical protein